MPFALHPRIDVTDQTGTIRAQEHGTHAAAFRANKLVTLCALHERRIVFGDHHELFDFAD